MKKLKPNDYFCSGFLLGMATGAVIVTIGFLVEISMFI